MSTPELETARLILRQFTPDDLDVYKRQAPAPLSS